MVFQGQLHAVPLQDRFSSLDRSLRAGCKFPERFLRIKCLVAPAAQRRSPDNTRAGRFRRANLLLETLHVSIILRKAYLPFKVHAIRLAFALDLLSQFEIGANPELNAGGPKPMTQIHELERIAEAQ